MTFLSRPKAIRVAENVQQHGDVAAVNAVRCGQRHEIRQVGHIHRRVLLAIEPCRCC